MSRDFTGEKARKLQRESKEAARKSAEARERDMGIIFLGRTDDKIWEKPQYNKE